MSEVINYPLEYPKWRPGDDITDPRWYTTTVLSGPQVGEEGFWEIDVVSPDGGRSYLYGSSFRVFMNYNGETEGADRNYSAPLNAEREHPIRIPALAGWRSFICEEKGYVGDWNRPKDYTLDPANPGGRITFADGVYIQVTPDPTSLSTTARGYRKVQVTVSPTNRSWAVSGYPFELGYSLDFKDGFTSNPVQETFTLEPKYDEPRGIANVSITYGKYGEAGYVEYTFPLYDPLGGGGGTGSGGSTGGGLIPVGFTNSGQPGDLITSQSSMRQWFVRAGAGTGLSEPTTTTVPVATPVETIEHTDFSTVSGQDWETFKASRSHYSETFGTTVPFVSSTPGATYPDASGISSTTWYPLTYSVNVATPQLGKAGQCTLTVNVLQDAQAYKRLKKKLGGPPDNPFMVDRTDADGYPIHSSVYPHGVRFYVSYAASNTQRSRSDLSNQTLTDIIEIPALVEYEITHYPTSFTFDVPENWWGIQIDHLGYDTSFTVGTDPDNGYPVTAGGSRGGTNFIGVSDQHFMGVAPTYTWTETTGGMPAGEKDVTTGGVAVPFGGDESLITFQSSMRQWFVRDGGIIDMGTGAPIDSSGGTGGGGFSQNVNLVWTYEQDRLHLYHLSVVENGSDITWSVGIGDDTTGGAAWHLIALRRIYNNDTRTTTYEELADYPVDPLGARTFHFIGTNVAFAVKHDGDDRYLSERDTGYIYLDMGLGPDGTLGGSTGTENDPGPVDPDPTGPTYSDHFFYNVNAGETLSFGTLPRRGNSGPWQIRHKIPGAGRWEAVVESDGVVVARYEMYGPNPFRPQPAGGTYDQATGYTSYSWQAGWDINSTTNWYIVNLEANRGAEPDTTKRTRFRFSEGE